MSEIPIKIGAGDIFWQGECSECNTVIKSFIQREYAQSAIGPMNEIDDITELTEWISAWTGIPVKNILMSVVG